MRFPTKPAMLAVASLAVLALGSCGTTPTTPAAPQEQSVLAMLVSDAKGSLQKVSDRATKAESVSMKMNGKIAGETARGEGVLLYGKDPKAQFTFEVDGETSTVRMIGTVLYVEVPTAHRAELEGKRWMKMDLGEVGGPGYADQLDDMDPVRQVKTLLAAESVTVVGEETIDGVKTVHYTVALPLSTYLGQFDAKARKAAEKELTKQAIKEIKADLWVDEKYQPRRAKLAMGSTTDFTVDYTGYGQAVTVEAPPAAEVFDLAEMLERLKTGG